MLLNSFGQPTLITCEKSHLHINDLRESPLLMCHKNALTGKCLPKNWSGCMYGSENVLEHIKQANNKINKLHSQIILLPNETIDIRLKDNPNKSLNLNSRLKWTMFQLDNENCVYLIKAQNVTSLLTDNLSENMDAFLRNNILRKSIKDGIDVLYINDGIYHKSSQLPIYPTECLLGALVTLVQPRYVVGFSELALPQCILDCCRPEDTS